MADIAINPDELRGITREKAPEPEIRDEPVHGYRYNSHEFAQKEWDHMWTRIWHIAGRVEQIPNPGDYVTYELKNESIIVVRGADRRIRAFYNVCQHRGNRLVNAEAGSLAGGEFQCAYHGWRFGDTGELNWVYCEEDFPQGSPCGKRNLVEMPCDTWAGFLWFNMDPTCDSLGDWLDPVGEHLDSYRMEEMRRTHWVTVEGDFNWKCVQDNFNESYHLPYVHPGSGTMLEEHYSGCQFDMYPSGHARMLMPGGGPSSQHTGSLERTMDGFAREGDFWGFDVEPYRDHIGDLRVALQKHKRAHAESKGFDYSTYSDAQLTDHYHYTLFPNLSFSMKPEGCIFLRGAPHPTDPEKTVFDMWYLTMFPKDATEYFSMTHGDYVPIGTEIPHETGKAGEVSCGQGIDQDVAIWNTQHKGLTSRGYRGDYMAHQERRIKYFHQTVDRYLAMDPT